MDSTEIKFGEFAERFVALNTEFNPDDYNEALGQLGLCCVWVGYIAEMMIYRGADPIEINKEIRKQIEEGRLSWKRGQKTAEIETSKE